MPGKDVKHVTVFREAYGDCGWMYFTKGEDGVLDRCVCYSGTTERGFTFLAKRLGKPYEYPDYMHPGTAIEEADNSALKYMKEILEKEGYEGLYDPKAC
jgi:hypothetical protein